MGFSDYRPLMNRTKHLIVSVKPQQQRNLINLGLKATSRRQDFL